MSITMSFDPEKYDKYGLLMQGKKTGEIYRDQLLQNKIDIRDVSDIQSVLDTCSEDEQKIILQKLGNMIISHDVGVLQYKRIFGINDNTEYRKIPVNVMMRIKSINKKFNMAKVSNINPGEIYFEIHRIEQFRGAYISQIGTKMGFTEKSKYGKLIPKVIVITEEIEQMAKNNLEKRGEYICRLTMMEELSRIAKNEITKNEKNNQSSQIRDDDER